ncbi:hypothetical protein R70006_05067 [Paraburkholderia domus]|uniref:hypothetical protein n=1 Tax=Paraburkholderia domus TaxID=2793075 RepID=UPI00191380F4|nr:hypothetical protein [Paraburkholderia domus]MBK5051696.1 hypothetical protein [Burkholderia sp. R-70006]CAE6795796.1 hypothetical protein R70006_05067 [Paraburkholderia domus]
MIVNATLDSWVGSEPMFTAYSPTNRYRVYKGCYTAVRWARGRQQQFSLMHPRYAGLRAQIDAAIAAIAPATQARKQRQRVKPQAEIEPVTVSIDEPAYLAALQRLDEPGAARLDARQAAIVKWLYCREDEWPYWTIRGTIWLFDTSRKRRNRRPLAAVTLNEIG